MSAVGGGGGGGFPFFAAPRCDDDDAIAFEKKAKEVGKTARQLGEVEERAERDDDSALRTADIYR